MLRFPRLVIPCIVLLTFALAGCSDNGTEPGVKAFALDLVIQDTTGLPVPGLEAKLHVPIPGFPVAVAKSVTTIQFGIPETAHITLNVYDLEERLVREVWGADLMAGVHQVAVAGGHDEDFLLGSRIYRYELVAAIDGAETFRDSKYMSVYTSPDVDQRPVLGVSDQDGLIRFTDKTHFPFLYDLGPQPMVDENGNPVGTFEFGDVVIIRLHDLVAGLHMNHEVRISEGHTVQTLVWDAEKAVRDVTEPAVAPASVAGSDTLTSVVILPLQYELRQNLPNPFN